MQRKRKSRKSSSNSSTLSLLRKELREGDLQRLLGLPSRNSSAPDPLLSSFISPTRSSSPVTRQTSKVSEEKHIERYSFLLLCQCFKRFQSLKYFTCLLLFSKRQICITPVSLKDREEKMKKSEFVQRLLSSAIFGEV